MPRRLLVLALAILLAGAAFAQDERVALVTSLQGKGTVVRPHATVGLHNVMLLFPGDVVRLEAKARMTMALFRGGQRITAVGPCRLQLDAGGARLVEGKTPLARDAARLSPSLTPGGQNVTRIAGAIAYAKMPPEEGAPQSTTARIWSGTPTLTWTGGQAPFTVRVSGPQGQVWEAQSSGRSLAWAGPRLAEDVTYYFEVLPAGSEMGAYGEFRIVSAAFRQKAAEAEKSARAAAKANPRDTTPWVLLMALYNENDMLDDAIRVGREATKVQPKDGGLRLALSKLLDLAGRAEEAQAEGEAARKLGASDF